MAKEIDSLEENIQRREEIHSTQISCIEANLEGVKRQLVALSDQLAQRTILYENQERRWRSTMTSKASLFSEKDTELVKLSARFEQLLEQYNRVDAERLQAVMENRDLRATLTSVRSEQIEERQRLNTAEEELSTTSQRLQELQIELERIKGADLTELEQTMAAETELIRELASDRESNFLRQVQQLRESLSKASSDRDELIDEIYGLKERNKSLEFLLHDIRSNDLDISHSFGLSKIPRSNYEVSNTDALGREEQSEFEISEQDISMKQDLNSSNAAVSICTEDEFLGKASSVVSEDVHTNSCGLDETYLTGTTIVPTGFASGETPEIVTDSLAMFQLANLQKQLTQKEEECAYLVSSLKLLQQQVYRYWTIIN
jgi:chromosome segregation ATPase